MQYTKLRIYCKSFFSPLEKKTKVFDLSTFKGRLGKSISDLGISPRKFAIDSKIPYTTINTYLNTESEPTSETLKKLKSAGLNIDYLLNGKEDKITWEDNKSIDYSYIPRDISNVFKFRIPVRGGSWNLVENSRHKIIPMHISLVKGIKEPAIVDVVGDSMYPKIHEKDSVIFDMAAQPKNNDIVVCTYESNTIIKYFRNHKGLIKLESENNSYAPIIVESDLTIHGVVKKIIHNI